MTTLIFACILACVLLVGCETTKHYWTTPTAPDTTIVICDPKCDCDCKCDDCKCSKH